MREKLRTRWEQSALKAWADGKLRLSRGKKLVLNLVIIALAGLWLWGLAGYPLPTAELEFRRLERTCLRRPSEIAARINQQGDIYLIGFTQEEAVTGNLQGGVRALTFWPLPRTGTGLMPATPWTRSYDDLCLLSLHAPEGAVSARLELQVAAWVWDDGENTRLELPGTHTEGQYRQEHWNGEAQGERLDSGEFLFRIEVPITGNGMSQALTSITIPQVDRNSSSQAGRNPEFLARAVFYDASGQELGEARLSQTEIPSFGTEG